MQTDMTPISTFADLMTCILPWTYSALSPNEVPISLATRTVSDFSTPVSNLARKRSVIRLSKLTCCKDLCVPICSW